MLVYQRVDHVVAFELELVFSGALLDVFDVVLVLDCSHSIADRKEPISIP